MSLPKFSGTPHSLHAELKAKISEYFVQVGTSTTGNYQLFIKAVLLTLAFIAICIWQVFESILLGVSWQQSVLM
jgi:linoleoyl-CoA desaturase